MVERLLARITAPVRGLHEAAYILAGLTLASQILALLRDRTFAHLFGAGQMLDLYYASFRIPDLVFALVSSLVSAYVLIPRIAGGSSEENRALLTQSVSFLLIAGGGICLVLGIFAPQLLSVLYPNLATSPFQEQFILLTRILLAQPVLLGISGAIQSVTQVHRRFTLFALSPVLYNFGIIFGALFLFPRYGLSGIGIGVILGALLHGAIHIPILLGAKVFPGITLPSFRVIRSIARDSIPRSLALGMGSFTALALTALAARVGNGSVSVFTFASNLELVPLSLIGASYAVAAFPALSEHSAANNKDEFTRVLSSSARQIILWSVVSLGLIVVLRAHLVRAILGTGAFDWDATRLTAALLAILAVGLVAQGLVLLFSRALYAAKQSWWPFFYQLVGGAITVIAAFLFIFHPPAGFLEWLSAILRVSDVSGTAVLGIALASTLGQMVLAIWSLIALRRSAPGLATSLARPLLQGLMAAVVSGVVAYAVLAVVGGVAPLTTLFAVFTEGALAGMVGLASAALTLLVLKNQEFTDVMLPLARFVRGQGRLAPSAEEPVQP